MRTNPAADKAAEATKPITITITGELARRIREAARLVGCRPSTFGLQCAKAGELATAPDERGRLYRRDMAPHFMQEARLETSIPFRS